MPWSTSELRVRLAPLNRFKPSSKIFYWPFQGSTPFVDLLCFFLSCVCYAFVSVCLYVPCGHLLGKGWPLGSRLWCPTVTLSLSHWYPGLGVILDCIDSCSLHPYLLYFISAKAQDLTLITCKKGSLTLAMGKCLWFSVKIKVCQSSLSSPWSYPAMSTLWLWNTFSILNASRM